MSRAWARGSTGRWRTVRAYVLARDRWVCGICKQPIDPMLSGLEEWGPQVHHTLGRAVTGDDPKYMVAAHRKCNLDARVEPRPRKISNW